MVDATATLGTFLLVLLLLDWVYPRKLRLFALGQFKSTPEDRHDFYANYRSHFGRRLGVAFTLSFVGAVVFWTHSTFKIQAITAVAVVALYVMLLAFDVWRAERRQR